MFGKGSVAPVQTMCDNVNDELCIVDDESDENIDEIDENVTLLEDPLSYELQQLKELGEQ